LIIKFRIKQFASLKIKKIFHITDQINGNVVNQVCHSLRQVNFWIKWTRNLIQICPESCSKCCHITWGWHRRFTRSTSFTSSTILTSALTRLIRRSRYLPRRKRNIFENISQNMLRNLVLNLIRQNHQVFFLKLSF